ncbi:hypothetical protein PR048_007202 [Dryococelus australis]|uniref:Uncharacterized protein n=1 Tax=Dryococelus australis TaxID=614101 RepID=A0ABQ9ICZ1_9NEOP|nr:hypothetical protein PR048_007202 [Dryococelus australis]
MLQSLSYDDYRDCLENFTRALGTQYQFCLRAHHVTKVWMISGTLRQMEYEHYPGGTTKYLKMRQDRIEGWFRRHNALLANFCDILGGHNESKPRIPLQRRTLCAVRSEVSSYTAYGASCLAKWGLLKELEDYITISWVFLAHSVQNFPATTLQDLEEGISSQGMRPCCGIPRWYESNTERGHESFSSDAGRDGHHKKSAAPTALVYYTGSEEAAPVNDVDMYVRLDVSWTARSLLAQKTAQRIRNCEEIGLSIACSYRLFTGEGVAGALCDVDRVVSWRRLTRVVHVSPTSIEEQLKMALSLQRASDWGACLQPPLTFIP